MSAIDMLIGFASDYQDDSTVLIDPASAEVAQLRVTVAQQRARIAALEQAVNKARLAIDDEVNHHGGGTRLLRAWLAAYPAPQSQANEVTP
jgi:hypothetical protein